MRNPCSLPLKYVLCFLTLMRNFCFLILRMFEVFTTIISVLGHLEGKKGLLSQMTKRKVFYEFEER